MCIRDRTELPLIRSIDEAVGEAKMSDEWRHAYMIYQIHQQDAELRGIAIGEDVYKRQIWNCARAAKAS